MENRNSIEDLIQHIRKMPLFRQLVPQEAGIGWPIPLRKAGKVYVTFPCFGFARTAEQGKTALYPPFALLTVTWTNWIPVEYVNLRFRNPWPEGQWEGQVGEFPHEAVAHLTVSQYREQRHALLGMYDEMLDRLAQGSSFDPAWEARFGHLLRLLMEPSLEPYYRVLGSKFFAHFLSTDEQGERSTGQSNG